MTVPTALAPDRPSRVQQLYGYAVCLIAIVTLLVSINGLVNAAFERADPLRAGNRYGVEGSLTSFEAFRATQRPEAGPGAPQAQPAAAAPDAPSEAELRARYEALRADQIAQVRFQATRSIVSSLLLIVLALGLFVWHWRWLRRLDPR